MPINKFGHHFLYESIPHKLTAAATISFDLSSYKSVYNFTLRRSPRTDTTTFTFENNSNTYKFEISGIIQQVDISLDTALFNLNEDNLIPPKKLIGATIN